MLWEECFEPVLSDVRFVRSFFAAYWKLRGFPVEVPWECDPAPLSNNAKTFLLKTEPAELVYYFEFLLFSGETKKHGIFYTPGAIVQRILDPLSLHGSIIDPACGSGIFLLSVFNKLIGSKDLSNEWKIREVMKHSIYGVDRDPRAVEITRLLLLTIASTHVPVPPELYEIVSSNIICHDSLLDRAQLELLDLDSTFTAINWKADFPSVFESGGFDFVLGNPPYGLSRGNQLTKQENTLLKHLYRDTRRGKLNKYIAFMAMGFSILKPSGVLSFIVPNSWLGIQGGEKIRRMLLDTGALESITIFGYPVFEDPSVEAVIFRAVKDARNTTFQIAVQDKAETPEKIHHVSHSRCLRNPDATIPRLWSERIEHALNEIEANSISIRDERSPFLPAIALQAYAEKKGTPPQTRSIVETHAFHSDSKLGPEYIPYLEGSDVSRFEVSWSGSYLRYGPWLAEPQKLERFTGPRIVLREILGKPPHALIAAYIDSPYLYNKSILHILPRRNDDAQKLFELLPILNSNVSSFLIYLLGRKSQRKLFPKIVNDDLLDLRFPHAPSKTIPKPEKCNEYAYESFKLSRKSIDTIEETLAHWSS